MLLNSVFRGGFKIINGGHDIHQQGVLRAEIPAHKLHAPRRGWRHVLPEITVILRSFLLFYSVKIFY